MTAGEEIGEENGTESGAWLGMIRAGQVLGNKRISEITE